MAKKNIHSIISGAGWIGSFAGGLVEELRKLGVPEDVIHSLGKPTEDGKVLVRKCAEKIAEMFKRAQNEFPITIDYDLFLRDMITVGKHDWVNSDITAGHFPISGSGKVECAPCLIHFDREMSTDAVFKELDKQGLCPAKIEELLMFGATYPDKQREFPITCFGSLWTDYSCGDRLAPCLSRNGSRRGLDLLCIDGDWDADFRFLAVRK